MKKMKKMKKIHDPTLLANLCTISTTRFTHLDYGLGTLIVSSLFSHDTLLWASYEHHMSTIRATCVHHMKFKNTVLEPYDDRSLTMPLLWTLLVTHCACSVRGSAALQSLLINYNSTWITRAFIIIYYTLASLNSLTWIPLLHFSGPE